MRYEACIRNLSLDQAQALYRLLVDLEPDEPFFGQEGAVWSGMIPSRHPVAHEASSQRTITIQPMRGEDA